MSSMRRLWPSIQPQHSATSSAPAWLIDAMPDAALAILIHTPRDVALFLASQAAKARGVANGSVGRSGAVALATNNENMKRH